MAIDFDAAALGPDLPAFFAVWACLKPILRRFSLVYAPQIFRPIVMLALWLAVVTLRTVAQGQNVLLAQESAQRTELNAVARTPPTPAVLLRGALHATTVTTSGGGDVSLAGALSFQWIDNRLSGNWTNSAPDVKSLRVRCGSDVWCPDIQGIVSSVLPAPLRQEPRVTLWKNGSISFTHFGMFVAFCNEKTISSSFGAFAPFGSPTCIAYLRKVPKSTVDLSFTSAGSDNFAAASPYPPAAGRLSIKSAEPVVDLRSLATVAGQGEQRLELVRYTLSRSSEDWADWFPIWACEMAPQASLGLLASLLPWVGPDGDLHRILVAALLLFSLCYLWQSSAPDPLTASFSSIGELHGMLTVAVGLVVVVESCAVAALNGPAPPAPPQRQEEPRAVVEEAGMEEASAANDMVSRSGPPRRYGVRGMAAWLRKPMARQMPEENDNRHREDSDLSLWLDEVGFRMMEPRFCRQGINTIDDLLSADIDETQLRTMFGMTATRPRKTLMLHIAALGWQEHEVEEEQEPLEPILAGRAFNFI